MSISNVLALLLPSFEAVNLKNNLGSNCDAIGDELLPRYQSLQALVGTVEGKQFKSKPVIDLSHDLVSSLHASGLTIKGLRQATMLEYIISAMNNVSTLRPFLVSCIERDIGKTMVTTAITFNKQTVLQLLDLIDFFVKYSTMLLNFVTAEELAAVSDSNIAVSGIGPNDLQYLRVRRSTYGIALRVLATPVSKLKADYAEIPEAIFDEDTYNELVKAFGSEKTDPLGMSGVSWPLSMVYSAKLNFAEWQMDTYDETVEAAKAAELRILLYRKQLAEGQGDAAIEILIEGHEKKLNELKRKRERLEKKYGLQ